MPKRLPRDAPDNLLVLSVPSDTRFLHALTNLASNAAELAGLGEVDSQNLGVAVVEAVTNVIEHAYAGATDREISVEFRVAESGLEVHIVHDGQPISDTELNKPPAKELRTGKTGGFGLELIRRLTDVVDYLEMSDGRHLCKLVKYSNRPSDQDGDASES